MAWTHSEFDGLEPAEASRALYELCYAINERERAIGFGTIYDDDETYRSPWAVAMDSAAEMGLPETGITSYPGEPFTHWLCHDGTEKSFPAWEQWSEPYTGEGNDLPEDFEDWAHPITGGATIQNYLSTVFDVPALGWNGEDYAAYMPGIWCGQYAMLARINVQRIYLALYRLRNSGHYNAGLIEPYFKVANTPPTYRWYSIDTSFSAWYPDATSMEWPPPVISSSGADRYLFGENGLSECLSWTRECLNYLKQPCYLFGAYNPSIVFVEHRYTSPSTRTWYSTAERKATQTGNRRAYNYDQAGYTWPPYDLEGAWSSAVAASRVSIPLTNLSAVPGLAGYSKGHSLNISFTDYDPGLRVQISAYLLESGPLAQLATGWVKGAFLSGSMPVTASSRLCSGAAYALDNGSAGVTPVEDQHVVKTETSLMNLYAIPTPGYCTLDESYLWLPDDLIAKYMDGDLGSRYAINCQAQVSVGRVPFGYSPTNTQLLYVYRVTDPTPYNHVITDISGELTYG